MKRFLWSSLLLIACLHFANTTCAQYYYYDNRYFGSDVVFEVGASVGGMNCLTDVNGSKSKGGLYINDFSLKNTRLNAGFYVSALYKGFVGARLESTYGSIQAYDSIAKGVGGSPGQRYSSRNASFKSSIQEVSLLAELYPLELRFHEDGAPRLSPYLLAGLGWFKFRPQTYLNGQWVDLKPLRLEGQGFPEYKGREPYHTSQVSIPFGAGFRFELSPLFNLKAEFLHRVTFTDYLDDVSTSNIDPALFDKYLDTRKAAQAKAIYDRAPDGAAIGLPRGYARNKDSYMTLNLKLGFVIGREETLEKIADFWMEGFRDVKYSRPQSNSEANC